MDEEQAVKIPRQLKINGLEGKGKSPTEKPVKEKERSGSKWVVVGILVASLMVSIIFKLSSGRPMIEKVDTPEAPKQPTVQKSKPVFRLFGPVEYRFTK